ncbi:MAG TPA: helix-turn-helix domain-containing protein [Anaerolineae bacterium]|nr:helix-turn-helix domain-containing protein [Anaerolineae bacterium]
MKELLSTRDIARMYQVTSAAVLNWIRAGKLKAYTTPGGHYRVAREDLDIFSRIYSLPPASGDAPPGLRLLLVAAEADCFDRVRSAICFRWPTAQVEQAHTEFEIGWWLARLRPTHIVVHPQLTPAGLLDHCRQLAHTEREVCVTTLPGSLDGGLSEWVNQLTSAAPPYPMVPDSNDDS